MRFHCVVITGFTSLFPSGKDDLRIKVEVQAKELSDLQEKVGRFYTCRLKYLTVIFHVNNDNLCRTVLISIDI